MAELIRFFTIPEVFYIVSLTSKLCLDGKVIWLAGWWCFFSLGR